MDLTKILAEIEKKFGKGTTFIADQAKDLHLKGTDTQSISLNYLLGNGGLVAGRVYELFGSESSGKTSLALKLASAVQHSGKNVLFLDMEHALNYDYAKLIGVDLSKLIISQPASGEEAFMVIKKMLDPICNLGLIVVDSVSALMSQDDADSEEIGSGIAKQARLMSQGLKSIIFPLSQSSCSLLFINQIRNKIGIMGMGGETTSGGQALRFYASVRLKIWRGPYIKDTTGQILGHQILLQAVKNKLNTPYLKGQMFLYYQDGLSVPSELLEYGIQLGIVSRSGSWYSLGDQALGNGFENSKRKLLLDKDLFNNLHKSVISKIFPT